MQKSPTKDFLLTKFQLSTLIRTQILSLFSNNIAVDPNTEKARWCHVDRSGDISYTIVRVPSSLYF